jgi:acyl carrier protein
VTEPAAPTIEETLRSVLVTDVLVDVPENEIAVDDGLRDVLGVDSLGFVELRAQCEARLGVTIADEDFNPVNFHSIRTVTDLVRRLRGGSAADRA